MRHIILISGKDSLATALVQRQREPGLPYEFVHNDVGWDLPETQAWLTRVEAYFGKPLIRCGDDLTEICYEENCLPLPFRRFCTKLAKIKPLNDYIGKSPSTVYFGLRADEPERVGYVVPPSQQMTVRYPLREAGLGLTQVWEICQTAGLLPPSFRWQWMEDRVRFLLGRDVFLLDRLPQWEQDSLLAWRSRSNCDRCFYARQYERIGLWEHHPGRYEAACELEERLCHRTEHTWVRGFRLRDLPARADKIKESRAIWIVRQLRRQQQLPLFEGDDVTDELAVTSCGLLCGK